ncbi:MULTISPECIES: calcium-binding protein [unclassified Cyanobium]|uniref:calcium-binding protein n=1 Tax=unclassified Cyanobium TaxID=2627006 RepID=UPI0020CD8508|nr:MULTISPECIES: calcium-binding protein [unclassified Cyanobium]MCP9858792.1 calcium-binding protein [Cyanobium sp. Cruz-8H5]MCP9866028.1 calcium-binding protein [Cyanobium sp. Cruz-8D1]
MSNETYGWQMESGVKFTGSHVHYIDYERSKFADFLNNDSPASDMVLGSGHLFNTVYNVFGEVVTAKTSDPLDLAGKWGNQTNPDGTIVEFLPDRQLTEGDFFFHSFCGAWYEPANKYGAGVGFSDDVWLMGEEWNIGARMFADPDGAGPLKGFDVANGTMGLASMVVDLKNEVAYTVPALGQAGYEKLMPINPGHEDYVVVVAAGYNHDINPAPLKVYVGRKGYDASGNSLNLDDPNLSERDRFLGSNGLLYGQLYGMAATAATYAQLGITAVDADTKMLDAYLQNASAPDQFTARYYPTSYRWDGFDTPEAVKDTEVFLWAKDGDLVGGVAELNEQPVGYTYFNSDTKVEHPAVDPDTTRSRYIQNHTRTGGLLGIEFASITEELTSNDLDGNGLPDYLSADVTRILAAVDGALTLDVGDKGVGHYDATGNPDGATAEQHIELKNRKMNDPDGLIWIKSSDADVLIVDEDSGNDYGERKFALVIDPETLSVEPEGTGYFLAQAGGTKNPRGLAGASAYGETFETARGSEFSGTWNTTALVARKADGSFYTQEELAGNGIQTVEQSRPLSEHVFIGVVQQPAESAGAVEATKSDYGGQIFQFSLDLPTIAPKPVVGTSGNDTLLQPGDLEGLTLIGNTIFTGAGDDEVDVALSDGFENQVFTGSGANTVIAGTRDVITGGSDSDQIWAIAGNGNRLSGMGGDDDFVIGSSGNRALGGEGNDVFTILDGAGTNYLSGGAGSDQFWLVSGPGDLPAAKQFVMDFKAGEDLVGLRGASFSDLSVTQMGADSLLNVSGTSIGHFTGVSAAALNNQANFVFA